MGLRGQGTDTKGREENGEGGEERERSAAKERRERDKVP